MSQTTPKETKLSGLNNPLGIRSLFQDLSPWLQLLFLTIFLAIGLTVTSIIMSVYFILFMENGSSMTSLNAAMENANFVRAIQLLQQLGMFLIPAILCAFLFQRNTFEYLKINKSPNPKFMLVALLLIIIVQPIIGFTTNLNQNISLPESMSSIEEWMQNMEAANMKTMELILSGNSMTILLVNLFIVAVMAGLVEECFFRGALQQMFGTITKNYHWAIWITAFIFSAIHFQFYGFLPRMLLGALLGYLFVWSGNLWVPITVHFVNNAMSVLLFRFYYKTLDQKKIEAIDGVENSWLIVIFSIVSTAAIVWYMSREYKKNKLSNNLV